jgi:hypothetical protein
MVDQPYQVKRYLDDSTERRQILIHINQTKNMSSLSEIYLKKETLETLLKTVTAKGENGVSITISTSDETNNYGQNVTGFVSQTKEQREAKAGKYYVGNGKVFWTDGKITVAKKKEDATAPAPAPSQESFNDLPF